MSNLAPRTVSLLLAALLPMIGIGPNTTSAWEIEIDAGDAGFDRAAAVTVDGAGDVVAGGRLVPLGLSAAGGIIKLDGDTGAELWRFEVQGADGVDDAIQDVAINADGDVLATGRIQDSASTQADYLAIKLDGALGTEIWRVAVNVGSFPFDLPRAGAFDAAGNIFMAGTTQATTVLDAAVVKVDGLTGTESWQVGLDGTASGFDEAWALTVDSTGNPCVAASFTNTGSSSDMGTACLSNATGAELWRRNVNGTSNSADMPYAITADSAGGVIVVGAVVNVGTGQDMSVVKYDSSSGVEQWRNDVDGGVGRPDNGRAVSIDAADDVLVAGFIQNVAHNDDFAIVKLDGSTGVEIWRMLVDGTAGGDDEARSVTSDSAGDVLVTGYLENAGSTDFVLLKFDGTTGAEIWRRELDGTANDFDAGSAVAVDAQDRVVAAGELFNTDLSTDFTVIKVNGTDGSDYVAPILIGGKKLKVKDTDAKPSKRLVLFQSSDALVAAPAPGSLGDPTLGGAELQVLNPATLEEDLFSLPAPGWTGLGKPTGAKGYKYKDAALANGPCKVALVKSAKAKAVCKGDQIAFSLDESTQGSLAVGLTLGTDKLLCAEFGGEIKKDTAAAAGKSGQFSAKDAPAPAPKSCPLQ